MKKGNPKKETQLEEIFKKSYACGHGLFLGLLFSSKKNGCSFFTKYQTHIWSSLCVSNN